MGDRKSVPLQLAEVLSRLSLSSGEVLHLVERGELPMIRAPFGMRFESDDIDRLMRERPRTSSSKPTDGIDHNPGAVTFL